MIAAYVPLGLALLVALLTLLSPLVGVLDRTLTHVALWAFGDFARSRAVVNRRQRAWLDGAHVGTTFRVYAAKTFLYATIAAVVGSIVGVYALLGVVDVLQTTAFGGRLPTAAQAVVESASTISVAGLFAAFLASSATVGVLAALGTYQVRWYRPRYVSGERARRIDATIKRNVAFMFALSRSGMPFTAVLRTLADNQTVYGETADEVAVAVKDVDFFGTDVLTAIQRLRDRTPSKHLEELSENLASVLQSGQSLSGFLQDQYEYYKGEEESQQAAFLELLGTLAEAYVTVFVAGPLFLITILVVIGLLLGGTLPFLRALVYFVLPLATLGFVVYLDSITEGGRTGADDREGPTEPSRFSDVRVVAAGTGPTMADGGTAGLTANRYRLSVYRRLRPMLVQLRNPGRLLTERPTVVLWASIPIGLAWTVFNWWPHLAAAQTSIGIPQLAAAQTNIGDYDDALIQSALLVLGTFSVTYEVARRRVKSIEAAIPDLLDRLASTNEAGMSIVESFGRVVTSELGALSIELERTWADIAWGGRVEAALRRLRGRVDTPAITRVATLTTNAMAATNDIGQVLRIAADEAQASRRLNRERHNEMLTYTVIVYLSFFVFLVIVVALDTIFVPAIPTAQLGTGTGAPLPSNGFAASGQHLTQAKSAAYSLVFFHAALVQAVTSGFVAGQMGAGSVKAGAKHATIMLAIAYAIFLVMG